MLHDFESFRAWFFASESLPRGVLRPAAVAPAADGTWRILRIVEATPKSATDMLVLGSSRARADAVITTGKILREEPDVTVAFPDHARADLEAFRREILGPEARRLPLPFVLTSGRGFDPKHRMIRDAGGAVVVTDQAGSKRLEDQGLPDTIAVVAVEAPNIREAVRVAREQFDARTISIDAGPTAANALHDDPLLIDEVFLAVYEGGLGPELLGPPFVSQQHMTERFVPASAKANVDEPSGPWSFQRFVPA